MILLCPIHNTTTFKDKQDLTEVSLMISKRIEEHNLTTAQSITSSKFESGVWGSVGSNSIEKALIKSLGTYFWSWALIL